MVNGHTHRAMVRRVRHLTIVNAGTLHRNDERRAAILDFGTLTVTFFEVLPPGLLEVEKNPPPQRQRVEPRLTRSVSQPS